MVAPRRQSAHLMLTMRCERTEQDPLDADTAVNPVQDLDEYVAETARLGVKAGNFLDYLKL